MLTPKKLPPMSQQEMALQAKIKQLENENKELKALSSNLGFYGAYFKELKTASTNSEAFNRVNERYYKLFGRYRYSSYDTFRIIKNRNLKKK